MNHEIEKKIIETDVLIIGGGTAGCYAALTLSKQSSLKVTIVEKANIKRSGCLAAGVNAVNAYITKGKTPQDYVDYASKDANGIVRKDLLLTVAENVNEVTREMEKLGLVILKDENGDYVARGDRNVKINGENFKPLLAKAVANAPNVSVLNHVNITDLLTDHGRVFGAVGFSVLEKEAYLLKSKMVLVATGGASGLYRPNNPGFSRHKMWYPPFNTGAGYAMGLKAGAEMTTFEMRFIALRCKDTISPTGSIAQGVGAKQVNAKGENYETKYGLTTSERVYGTVEENLKGNGPCYLRTRGIIEKQEEELLKAYLNMSPAQTLKWLESGRKPGNQDVEIEGTEPYIVGGHTASGFWINTKRETTIRGLYAAGDVAGGCPQKYVTGALAEGKLAAEDMISKISNGIKLSDSLMEKKAKDIFRDYERFLEKQEQNFTIEDIEEAMQKVMDEYAGGISKHYQYNERQLELAKEKIEKIMILSEKLRAKNMHELLYIYELKERLLVCQAVIAHLYARKETRWHAFNENTDYPKQNTTYEKYLNSVWKDGEIKTFWRKLVKGETYEHSY